MNLEAGDKIVAVAKLAEQDEETELELSPMAAELELEAADEGEEAEEKAQEELDFSGEPDDGGPDLWIPDVM